MSFMRHSFDPGPDISISSLAYEYPPAWNVPEHAHISDQLIYATRGVMEIAAEEKLWLIPPQFAVWIPADVRHAIRMPAAVSMRTLYLRKGLVSMKGCAVLHVTPLLRELIVEAVRMRSLSRRKAKDRAFRDVLVLQIAKASPVPIMLAMPKDARVLGIATKILEHPRNTLESACAKAAISVRTLQRVFQKELGIDFETWRRQARLMKAVELLAEGKSVKQVAHAVGYRQASAFVAMFRRAFGLAPKAWISSLEEAA